MDILVLPNVGRRDLKRFFFALIAAFRMATAMVKKGMMEGEEPGLAAGW